MFQNLEFKTERLRILRWSNSVQMLSDLGNILTTKALSDLPPSMAVNDTPDGLTDWIKQRCAESDVFSVCTLENNRLVGLLILVNSNSRDDVKAIHLGYLFGEAHWGIGYATEVVRGLIYTLADFAPCRVTGGVAKGNTASARVLTKGGFHINNDQSSDHTDVFVIDI